MSEEWTYYSDADRATIRESAQTDWGRAIMATMEKELDQRLAHDLTVPATEAGHFHHYFCPEHKRMLTFDIERPHEHLCDECGTYLTGERYDLAWIRMLHAQNQMYLLHNTFLGIVREDATYLERIRDMLMDYADKYPGYEIHGHNMEPDAWYGGRMLAQTLDESNWLVHAGPAFLEARSVMTDEEKATIRENLLRPMSNTILRNQTGGNWQCWHNFAHVILGLCLDDEELIDTGLNDPDHGYHHMLATEVTDEGWWGERSPGYHYYPLHAMLMTAEAVRCRGIDLYQDDLHLLFAGPLDSLFADLTFPSHNDGWHSQSVVKLASLYELAAVRFEDPLFFEILARSYARGERDSYQALIAGGTIEPDSSPLLLPSTLYPDTGVAFLRSASRTVCVKYGPHGGGHGHPDKLSIILHNGKEAVLPDLGTPGYGVPDYTAWYKRTVSHNTVVVDGQDQQPTSGELLEFEATESGGRVDVKCDSAYPGVHLRRTLTMEGDTVHDVLVAESTASHLYDFVFLLREPFPVPAETVEVEMPEGNGYDRIETLWAGELPTPATYDLASLTFTLSSDRPCLLIHGSAPGLPGTLQQDTVMQPVYPLIVRFNGEAARLKTTWTFQ